MSALLLVLAVAAPASGIGRRKNPPPQPPPPPPPPATSADDAAIVAFDAPTEMAPRGRARVTLTLRNAGTSTWTADEGFKLGAVGDGAGEAARFGPGRFRLPAGARIAPGQTHRFEIDITAPSTAGRLSPSWQMVHEGVRWFGAVATATIDVRPPPPGGTLRPLASNPRFFADGSGRAVWLTGSHTWDNFQDWGGQTPAFDYDAYLDLLARHDHTFIRLWRWESTRSQAATDQGIPHQIGPHPWARTGPGNANDGRPRFDLDRWNQAYFDRLRDRVIRARDRGIHVGVMLFHEYQMDSHHPFHRANNRNGMNADRNGDGALREVHTLDHGDIVRRQEAYARKVVETLNDLDNVLYEIGNEMKRDTLRFQEHMVRFVKGVERGLPKRHPVGITSSGFANANAITNAELRAGPADWISPHRGAGEDYVGSPPPADGGKIVIADTDHLDGVLNTPTVTWVWRSFTRGVQPILMDAIQNQLPGWASRPWNGLNRPAVRAVREAMGAASRLAERVELERMQPRGHLASTGFCLAAPGQEYVVYAPSGGSVQLDLRNATGTYRVEWIRPRTGDARAGGTVDGGSRRNLRAPFSDAVLYVYRDSLSR